MNPRRNALTRPRALALSVVVAGSLLAVACGSSGSASSDSNSAAPSSSSGGSTSTGAPDAAAEASAPAITSKPSDRRPILQSSSEGTPVTIAVTSAYDTGVPLAQGDWADPFALAVGDEIYSYASNVSSANIPVAVSTSDTEGKYLGDALPKLPVWTSKGDVWAPSVYERSDGTYVMFYNSPYGITGHQCVGAATSSNPAGPFVDDAQKPMECPLSVGGAIDASMIEVGGSPYLIYKADGNCCDMPTSIWSVPLSDDLLTTTGQPTKLISDDQSWEAGVVEGPEMVEAGGKLYLFYSGNDWSTADYAVGVATCESITGPCTKPLSSPFHSSTADAAGPGGETFLGKGDKMVMAYHAWMPGQVDPKTGERRLYVGEVDFSGDTPTFQAYS